MTGSRATARGLLLVLLVGWLSAGMVVMAGPAQAADIVELAKPPGPGSITFDIGGKTPSGLSMPRIPVSQLAKNVTGWFAKPFGRQLSGVARVQPEMRWIKNNGMVGGTSDGAYDWLLPRTMPTTDYEANTNVGRPWVDPMGIETRALKETPSSCSATQTFSRDGEGNYHINVAAAACGSGSAMPTFKLRLTHSCQTGGGIVTNTSLAGPFSWTSGAPLNNGTGSQGCSAGEQLLSVHSKPVQCGSCTLQDYRALPEVNTIDWVKAGAPVSTTTTVKCQLSTGEYSTVTVTTEGTETIPFPDCESRWGGSTPVRYEVRQGVGGVQAPSRGSIDFPQAVPPEYAQCAGWSCPIQVHVDSLPCEVGAVRCTSWVETYSTDPSRVKCMMGPYQLAIADCAVLENAYNPQTGTQTKPKLANPLDTDLNPTTKSPEANPTTGTDPNTGTNPNPNPTMIVNIPGPKPENPVEGQNECWPSGWGMLNPASWVLQPIKCAMKWAFIPNGGAEAFIDWWDVTRGDWNGSPLGSWGRMFAGWGLVFGGGIGGVGCQGPPVPTGFLGAEGAMDSVIYPFEACSGVKATAAATSRLFLTAAILFVGGLKAARIIGRPFGYDLDLMSSRGREA